MSERKELICTVERVDPLPPAPERRLPPPPPPVPRRRPISLLAVGVTLFAAAFLLCDGFHALQARAAQHPEEDPLSAILSETFFTTTATARPGAETERAEPPAETGAETEIPPAVSESGTEHTSAVSSAVSETEAVAETAPPLTAEALYAFDGSAVPTGMIPIVPMDLSLRAYGETFLYNDTSYRPDMAKLPLSEAAVPAVAAAGEVSVLILHTHATEGYSEEGATWYDPATPLARADAPEEGVIAVGKVIADILNANGIVTVHSTVLHDKESYKDSYSRSAQTVQSYLARYPSIRLVIDVHRDSIMTSADQLVRPVTVVNGEAVAQVMCVVGSNASGAAHDGWENNLALAAGLRRTLNAAYGDLCRPVYVKKSTYNQQYAPASLLLEIGASGNSLAEAERAAALVAEALAEMMG